MTAKAPQSNTQLVFVPLGGAGEIGMNLNLYGLGPAGAERWLMVDLGVTFGGDAQPGVDVITPDPTFIVERRDALDGLVLTHAHEDHLGAVPYLWERLRCPIYATPFTASLLRRKLREVDFEAEVPLIEVPLGGKFSVGPFDLELITVTHSIPEPNAIAIRTPVGTVLHTGDWKFDPGPVIGPMANEEALKSLGNEGVLAMVCDSTNALVPGTSGSEANLLPTLSAQIGRVKGRVAVASFASNVARLETISAAAAANSRNVVLAGRSLKRIDNAARENGYLASLPAFIDENDAGYLPDDKMLLICTGSQGEPRAALSRIVSGDHPNITLGAGDTVIFSSRVIPGNELAIARLQNALIRRGVEIVTWKDDLVHVSGHPARDELSRMYALVRPRIAVPVHGEARHLAAHAELALRCQVPEAVVVENGDVVCLSPGTAGIIYHVPVGRLYVDGNRLVPADGEVVRERLRAIRGGAAVITVVLNGGGLATEPEITTIGLLDVTDGDNAIEKMVRNAIRQEVNGMVTSAQRDDEAVRKVARLAARRVFRESLGKKPVTTVHLVRV